MRKILALLALAGWFALPAFGDSVTVTGGYFMPRGDSDVWNQNRIETSFETGDLNGFAGSVRYDKFLGEYVNLSGGFSYYESDTTVQDKDFVHEDFSPIFRDISVKEAPIEVGIQVLPVGRNAAVIPYFGGGFGFYWWEYDEFGDFVLNRNGNNPTIITGDAFSDGFDPGFHIEGGVHIPFSRSAAAVVEAKYWWADGNLDVEGFDPAFDPIDLSGLMISGGVSFWF